MKQKNRVSIFRASLLSTVLAFAACSFGPDHHAQKQSKVTHVKAESPVAADDFIENVSVARLSLATHPEDMESVSGNLTAIKSYLSKKQHARRVKHSQLVLVMMDYKMKSDGALQQVMAPVARPESAFPLLQAVMDKLNTVPGTLHNIYLVSAEVAPDKSLVLPDDAGQVAVALAQEQAHILQSSSRLPPEEDINTQLTLMDFFMKHHYQDAAYLTLDNVKRMLANASQNKTIGEAQLKTLSSRLETLEGTLKVELPYKF